MEKIFDSLPIANDKFINFLCKIQQQYKNITYHNKTHAADLAQTFYFVAKSCDLIQKCSLDDWDMMAYVIAAACHDVGHPGFNNLYLIEKQDEISTRYNDISVLENYHVATTFEVLKTEKYNIFSELNTLQFKRVRKQMIGAILATDMSLHFSKIGVMKSKLETL